MSALFATCTCVDMQIKMLNSPSICENESYTELEKMLNQYKCRPCVPQKFDGTLQYATPVCMLIIVPFGCTGIG